MAVRNAQPKRSARYAEPLARLTKQRTGITRKTVKLVIAGREVRTLDAPQLVRERFYRKFLGRRTKSGRPALDTVHCAIYRYTFTDSVGARWTVLHGRVHDTTHGWLLNITGFWNLTAL